MVPESMCRHLDDVVLCQSDEIHCSAIDNISRPWTVPKALSPCIQVIISSVIQARICLAIVLVA
jgi:hypothetical protein